MTSNKTTMKRTGQHGSTPGQVFVFLSFPGLRVLENMTWRHTALPDNKDTRIDIDQTSIGLKNLIIGHCYSL